MMRSFVVPVVAILCAGGCDPLAGLPPPVTPQFDGSQPPQELHDIMIRVDPVGPAEKDLMAFEEVMADVGLHTKLVKDADAPYDATLTFHAQRTDLDGSPYVNQDCSGNGCNWASRILLTAEIQADGAVIDQIVYELRSNRNGWIVREGSGPSAEDRLSSAILHSPKLLAFARHRIATRPPPPEDPIADERAWHDARAGECLREHADACAGVRDYLKAYPGGHNFRRAQHVLKSAGQ